MFNFWRRNLFTLGLITLAALAAWPLLGAAKAWAVYSVALLVVVLHHLRNLSAFDRWLQSPAPVPVPEGSGIWDEIFARLARLVRSQSQSRQQLTSALERLQQATAAMPEGVVILDEIDRIQWCNPVAEQHFGIDRERDAGQQITYLARQPQFLEYLNTQNYSEPLVLRQTRSADLVLSVQLVPYGDKQKLLISRDITRLERVETMRRDFVANVSHELRTPLTVVGGFLETLTDMADPAPEMLRRSLALMADQTRRMQRLVEDLLTLSKLENEQNLLREDDINVPEMLRGLYSEAQSLSAGRHQIVLNLESDHWLLGSTEELRSAFGNLVSNAVRYTANGGRIALGWEARGEQAVFSVEDSGIGIEPEHIPRLTERFYRVDRSRSRETGGTGLGLAIVKHVLNRHQARLDIASQPGKGSRFSACFPAKRVLPADREATSVKGESVMSDE